MKIQQIISCLFIGVCLNGFSQVPEITELAYFFDVDPGEGNRMAISVTANETIDISTNISTIGLSEGFHTLSVLAKDENEVWGLIEKKPFFITQSISLNQNNISAMEYYIDFAPIQGSGEAISISNSPELDFSQNIATTGLAEGFHTIGFRAQDEKGTWGLVESKPFYINQSVTLAQNNISAMEYYIDTDPVQGSGTAISIASSTDLNFTEDVSTVGLTQGFHSIGFRAQDENGVWGLSEYQPFYISLSSTIGQNNITNMEYYIDADPGQGDGVSIAISPGANFDFTENVPTTGLNGFHTITVRAMDENSVWGIVESKPFYVNQSVATEQNILQKIEYFIDSDPGHGNGIEIVLGTETNVNLLENVSTTTLSEGFHVITFRALDENDVWGLIESKPFFIGQSTSLTNPNLVQLEYFFNEDPGTGNGTFIPVSDLPSIDVIELIPTEGLSVGFHTFNLRGRDEKNIWGLIESTPFYVDVARNITLVEYALGTDPGIGNGTQAIIETPSREIDLDLTLSSAGLEVGEHQLYVRSFNDQQEWSNTDSVTINICSGALADFSVGAACVGEPTIFSDLSVNAVDTDTYEWDFDGDGSIDENTTGDADFTFTEVGVYTASLLVDREGCATSISFEVVVNDVATPVISVVSDNGRDVVLTSDAESGNQWYESGEALEGETNQTLSVERTYFFGGDYTVVVTSEEMCSAASVANVIAILGLQNTPVQLNIWPNPVTNRLNIVSDDLKSENREFQIVDMMGKTVLDGSFTLQNESLDVAEISIGTYLLLIKDENKTQVLRFVKE
ncbi:MAG: T9SS type A sorting domain-containing protein [Reichenbachiella sp.]